jgi:hypothetical protein
MMRSRCGTLVLAALVWAAGCFLIWWALPPAPRSWQPPADQEPLGFLSDGRTLVTIASPHYGYNGPIQLWDTDSGRVRASYFAPEDAFQTVVLDRNEDRVRVIQLQENEEASPLSHFLLRMHDAWTGRELARFSCHSSMPEGSRPYRAPAEFFISYWIVTPDGKTTAFVCTEVDQDQIEWHEVASGQRLLRLPGPSDRIVFSPDSRRFASDCGGTVTIWEVPTGHKIASFTVPQRRFNCGVGYYALKEFSPDGELVLDEEGGVWEVATGKMRFQVSEEMANCTFSADGRWLIGVQQVAKEQMVSWYDVATGQEEPGWRISLESRSDYSYLRKATPDGRLLFSEGYHQESPSLVRQQLAWLPGFASLGGCPPEKCNYIILDEKHRREVARGKGSIVQVSPQGSLLLTMDQLHQKCVLWDLPPRKPLTWFLVLAAALGVGVVLLARWRLRRQHPEAQKEPAPAPLSG